MSDWIKAVGECMEDLYGKVWLLFILFGFIAAWCTSLQIQISSMDKKRESKENT